MVGHEHIASNANTKVSDAAAVFDEGGMYLRCREQAGPNMGVERYEIDRRVEALEDQMQSWRLTFEHALHSECCSVRFGAQGQDNAASKTIRSGQRTLQPAEARTVPAQRLSVRRHPFPDFSCRTIHERRINDGSVKALLEANRHHALRKMLTEFGCKPTCLVFSEIFLPHD